MYLKNSKYKSLLMSSEKYVLSFDAGTSSVKALLIDNNGTVLSHYIKAYPFYSPKPGWMEQDPADYWQAVVRSTRQIVTETGINVRQIGGLVFTTQAMGIIPIDKDGNVLRRNITWIDGRAEEEAIWFMKRFFGRRIFKTLIGIEVTGKDVLPKLLWFRKKEPEIYKKTDKILDVNGYLKFRATGEKAFEWSGASSYTFDLRKKDWTRWLFRIIGFDLEKLPRLVKSTDNVGGLTKEASDEMGIPEGIPVFGGCDDTQSAAIGSGSSENNDAHIYLGTSAWVGITTERNVRFRNGAVCLQSADPEKNIAVGITESAGSNIDWIIENMYSREKNDLTIPDVYALANEEAELVLPGSEDLMMTPWLFGERCPVGTTTTRGTMFNLGHHHNRGHIMRAMSEGIAYNLRWIIENFEHDYGFKMPLLRVVGGGTQSDTWMQIIADITNRKIETTSNPKMAGAIGAAMCAFVGLGIISGFNEVKRIVKPIKIFVPNPDNALMYTRYFNLYKGIYSRNKNLYQKLNFKLA
jgi:xylulokinase